MQNKKFILILNNEIVKRYEASEPTVFGGPWVEGVSIEVPHEIELSQAEVEEQNGVLVVIERPLSADEEFQKEVNESQSYVADIQKGQQAIAFFRLLNDKKGLTKAQKKQAMGNAEIQSVLQMLSLGKLPDAAELIEAIQADGVIVTNLDKQKMLKFLGV
jgi:hypothetical protein